MIIGFGLRERAHKMIYDYQDVRGEPQAIPAQQINPYLADAPNVLIRNRGAPICRVPEVRFGSMPNDGKNLLLSADQRKDLIRSEPQASAWLRRFMGTDEFLYDTERWCLWLKDITPVELRSLPLVRERVIAVRTARAASKRPATKKLASTPTLFGENRQPLADYLAIPEVSSERRTYVPIGFLPKRVIASNKLYTMAEARLHEFGVLTSAMHMAWIRTVAGRLVSRFQYSAGIVYNNFPWPIDATDKQRAAIEHAAQAVLDTRDEFPGSTLADLYDPLTMPPALLKAHQTLDRAVDAAYVNSGGKKTWASDAERVAFLFGLYQKLTSLLPAAAATAKPKRVRRAR